MTKNAQSNAQWLHGVEKVIESGKMKNRVYFIGIELEGGWKKLPEGAQPTHDGSVRIPAEEAPRGLQERVPTDLGVRYRGAQPTLRNQDEVLAYERVGITRAGGIKTGEIPSPPMEVKQFPAWIRKYYPSHVNETCGLHVHMSFKSTLNYQRLMVPEYSIVIVKGLEQWAKNEGLPKEHPIWGRCKGGNEYCQHVFYADLQAQAAEKDYNRTKVGHRYTVINYCYTQHHTLECRLLPMMATAEQAIRAIQRVLDLTNGFLVMNAEREGSVKTDCKVVGDEAYKEDREIYV